MPQPRNKERMTNNDKWDLAIFGLVNCETLILKGMPLYRALEMRVLGGKKGTYLVG